MSIETRAVDAAEEVNLASSDESEASLAEETWKAERPLAKNVATSSHETPLKSTGAPFEKVTRSNRETRTQISEEILERWDKLPEQVRAAIKVPKEAWCAQQASKAKNLERKREIRSMDPEPRAYYRPDAREFTDVVGFDPYRERRPLGKDYYRKGPVFPAREGIHAHELEAADFYMSKGADVKGHPQTKLELRAQKRVEQGLTNKESLRGNDKNSHSFDAIVRWSPEDEGRATEFKNIAHSKDPINSTSRVIYDAVKQLGTPTPERRIVDGEIFIDARKCAAMKEEVAKDSFHRMVTMGNENLEFYQEKAKVGLPAVVHVAIRDDLSVYFRPQWDSGQKRFITPNEESITLKHWES